MAATLVENPTPSALQAVVSNPASAGHPGWSSDTYLAKRVPERRGRIGRAPAPSRAEAGPRRAREAFPSRAWRPLHGIGLCFRKCSANSGACESATADWTPAEAVLRTTRPHRQKSGGGDRALPV